MRPKVRVSGLCLDPRGLLLAKHTGHTFWTLIGGAWEDGESLPEALHREFVEELAYEVAVKELIFIGEFHDAEEQVLDLTFEVRPLGPGDAPLVLETNGSLVTARFFPLEELGALHLKPLPFWDIWLPVLLAQRDRPAHPFYGGRYNGDD